MNDSKWFAIAMGTIALAFFSGLAACAWANAWKEVELRKIEAQQKQEGEIIESK